MLASNFTKPNTIDIDIFAHSSGPLVQSGQPLNFWTSLNTTNGTRYFQGTCSSASTGTVRIKLYLTHGATSSGVLGINSQGSTFYETKPWLTTDADKAAVNTMINDILSWAQNSTIITPISGLTEGDQFVGTAMMGDSNDGLSVVDTNTQV